MEADHAHILFEYAPDIKLTELVNKIKSRLARRDYPVEFGKYYWKPLFGQTAIFGGPWVSTQQR